MGKRNVRYLIFVVCVIIVCIITFLCFTKPQNRLKEIEKGNYSCINDNRIQRQLSGYFSSSFYTVKWVYEDINKDGIEDLILEDITDTVTKIIGIFTIENQDVTIVLWDDVDVTSYYEMCSKGILCYAQYYGTYDNERYELYSYDNAWNKILIKGLELYDIEDISSVQQLDESLKLDREGVHYLEFIIQDEKKKYIRLTEEEWLKEFSALFGKMYDGDILKSACHAEYQENSPEYVFLEGEMHEILEENIASGSPYSVYDNAALCEVLKETLEDGEWIAETCDSFFEAEYFVFDFNGDGKEDYLVTLTGAGYGGSGGKSVSIFLGGDVLQEVFGASVRFYGGVMVLNEKTGGLYNIAFDGYDVIWKYDERAEWYRLSP